MAKELPYFRFEISEWDHGNIQKCSKESKGLFVDVCCSYWARLGELDYALALQKHCNNSKDVMQQLIDYEIILIDGDQIVIEFLDEQLNDFQDTAKKRTDAANKRWDAKAMQKQCKSNAIRVYNIREDNKEIGAREIKFRDSLTSFVEKYGETLIKDFYDYWREPNKSKSKMRWEQQKTWDLSLRLKKWEQNNDRWKK